MHYILNLAVFFCFFYFSWATWQQVIKRWEIYISCQDHNNFFFSGAACLINFISNLQTFQILIPTDFCWLHVGITILSSSFHLTEKGQWHLNMSYKQLPSFLLSFFFISLFYYFVFFFKKFPMSIMSYMTATWTWIGFVS